MAAPELQKRRGKDGRRARAGKWIPFWVVLKADNVEKTLYFYENEDTRSPTACSKFNDRETWRVYITGLATGAVPRDADLSADHVQKIISQLSSLDHFDQVVNNDIYNRSRGSTGSHRDSYPSQCSSSSDSDRLSRGSGTVGSRSSDVQSRGSGGQPSRTLSTSSTDGPDIYPLHNENNGGPFMVHKFYLDSRNQAPPSWFFDKVDRNITKEILEKGCAYGNTLMRLSSKYRDDGSYVISKRNHAFNFEIEHYEVIRTAEGYMLNIENVHKAMRCLQEVMDFFIKESGAHDTHPMTCNDLKKLGIYSADYSPYATEIKAKVLERETGEISKPTSYTPRHVESDQSYLEPIEKRKTPQGPRDRTGRETWTGGIVRNQPNFPIGIDSPPSELAPATPNISSYIKRNTVAVVNPSVKIKVHTIEQSFEEEEARRKLNETIACYDNAGSTETDNNPTAAASLSSTVPAARLPSTVPAAPKPPPEPFNGVPSPPQPPPVNTIPSVHQTSEVKSESPYNDRPLPNKPVGSSLEPIGENNFLQQIQQRRTKLQNEPAGQNYPSNFNRNRRNTEPAILLSQLPESGSNVKVVSEDFLKKLNVMIAPQKDPPFKPKAIGSRPNVALSQQETIMPDDVTYVDGASANYQDEDHNYEELPFEKKSPR